MPYITLVGLNVTDHESYQAYREGMMPILESYGGGFGYDFHIAETLRSETDAPINRVFSIHFPDEAAKNTFFADEAYLKVRQQYFEPAVSHITRIASFVRE